MQAHLHDGSLIATSLDANHWNPMPAPPVPRRAVHASATFHRAVQRATRLFGGRYGKLPTYPVEPSREQVVEAGPVSLKLLAWDGGQTPVVLLHGLNNNAWSWARVASQLAPRRRVLAVSQRGHGGSSSPQHGYRLHDTTRDLLTLLDSQRLDRVHLGGHSWGGKVAMHFAMHHGERVASLLLADPAPPQGLNLLLRAFPALTRAVLRAERGPFESIPSWERGGQSLTYLQHWDEIDRRLWKDAFNITLEGAVQHCLSESGYEEILQEAIAEDLSPLLPRVTCPVLLMRPTFSLTFLPGELRGMRRSLALCERYVPGDHTFIHTNACDTAAHMRAFLDSVGDE